MEVNYRSFAWNALPVLRLFSSHWVSSKIFSSFILLDPRLCPEGQLSTEMVSVVRESLEVENVAWHLSDWDGWHAHFHIYFCS